MEEGTHKQHLSWETVRLDQIAEINPTINKAAYDDNLNVAFVPMPAVEPESGRIDVSRSRPFGAVKKGYTHFHQGDVLFAKITPCMENGKMAVVPKIRNGVGFGSSEFHVIRPANGVSSEFIYYFVSSRRFRYDAEHNMTGAVGQRRVPTPYLSGYAIPVPPSKEQWRIVARLEELFSELDKGVESLKTAREQLKVYRQAVLKHAFEGRLTADWRAANPDKLEAAGELLARVKVEREARYQQQLKEWKIAIKAWEAAGREGKKPSQPKLDKKRRSIEKDELAVLPRLPSSWRYVRLSEIADVGSGMSVSKQRKLRDPVEIPYLRVANVQRGKLVLDDVKTMRIERYRLADLELKEWDVLFNEGGDRDKLGRGWVWECQVPSCITQNHVFRASTVLGVETHAKFVSHWGNTFGRAYFQQEGKQTTNLASINKTVLNKFPVPLSGLDEQSKILEAIESIFSVIDQFEDDIETAILRSDALRQSILKNALSGQLVPQDPNDEPASVLLERIRAERSAHSSKRSRKRRVIG